MGYPPSYATPAGWYPDPWYPQSMRYWDGATWTAHAQTTAPTVRVDPAAVRRWAQRIPWAFWAEAACDAISAVASPLVFGAAVDDMFDGNQATFSIGPGLGGGNLALQALSLGSLAALIMLAVWGHHITSTARALGLRTTLSPDWAAAGWLLPIINFWFPYQVVRDALPPGHPARGRVGWWWGLRISTTVLTILAMLFAFASPAAGAVVGICAAAAFLGAAYLAHDLATAIGEAHEQILQRATGVPWGAPL